MPIGKLSWRGRAPVDAKNWRSKLLAEVGRELDPARVDFVDKLPYEDYLSLLQVSPRTSSHLSLRAFLVVS